MLFRYPFRCDSVPRFDTQDTADAFVAEYQREGRILPCQYLAVVPSSVSTFSPWCVKDGFDNRRREHDDLAVYEFHGCPLRCPFYKPHRRTKARIQAGRRGGDRSATRSTASWVVVLLVLLLVLAAFGAAWWWRQDLLFNVSMVKELVAR